MKYVQCFLKFWCVAKPYMTTVDHLIWVPPNPRENRRTFGLALSSTPAQPVSLGPPLKICINDFGFRSVWTEQCMNNVFFTIFTVLVRYGYPGCVFATCGVFGGGAWFWRFRRKTWSTTSKLKATGQGSSRANQNQRGPPWARETTTTQRAPQKVGYRTFLDIFIFYYGHLPLTLLPYCDRKIVLTFSTGFLECCNIVIDANNKQIDGVTKC